MKMKIKKSNMMSKNPKKIEVMERKKKNQMNRKHRKTMLKTKAKKTTKLKMNKKTIPIKKMRIKRIERHMIYKYSSLFFSWSNFSFSFACASSLLYINVIRNMHNIVDLLIYRYIDHKR